jgi:hypothetical protein
MTLSKDFPCCSVGTKPVRPVALVALKKFTAHVWLLNADRNIRISYRDIYHEGEFLVNKFLDLSRLQAIQTDEINDS